MKWKGGVYLSIFIYPASYLPQWDNNFQVLALRRKTKKTKIGTLETHIVQYLSEQQYLYLYLKMFYCSYKTKHVCGLSACSLKNCNLSFTTSFLIMNDNDSIPFCMPKTMENGTRHFLGCGVAFCRRWCCGTASRQCLCYLGWVLLHLTLQDFIHPNSSITIVN